MKQILVYLVAISFSLPLFAKNTSKLQKAFDGETITVSGKVTSVNADAFRLKTKNKSIIVEMDDWDADADGFKLKKGDRVVVRGAADKDLFQKNRLEAGSVYVENLNSYFYASAADEEGAPVLLSTSIYNTQKLPEGAYVDLIGKVQSVVGRAFTIDTGVREVNVSTGELIFNPLDDTGQVQVDVGDQVRLGGIVDDGYFNKRSIKAAYIQEL
jgi:uncharacterized protein YdeI (BOF family)